MSAGNASTGHPRRLLILWASAVFALALGLRLHSAITAPLFTSDGAYYTAVAERVHGGEGLTIPYVWNYLGGIPESLPIPSNRYWMPMTSLLQAGAFALAGGASPLAAQMPSVVLGALLAAFTFALTYALFRRLEAAILAGVFWAISPQLVSIAASSDCFMPAAAFTSAGLYAIWRAREGGLAWGALAGVSAGLAYLTRSDGLLLAVVMGLWLARPLLRREGAAWRQAALFAGGFVVAAAPWWIRNAMVFGQPFAGGVMRTAWLVTYNDIFRTDAGALTAQRYFDSSQIVAAGFKAFVLYKELRLLAVIGGLTAALAVYAVIADRRRGRFAPWLLYTGLAIGVSALVFPYPAIKGGFWHIVAALCPFVFAAGAAGLVQVRRHARRSALSWPRAAAWVAGAATVGYFIAIHPAVLGKATTEPDPYAVVAGPLEHTTRGGAPVLTDNCWRLHHYTGQACAQFPTDGPAPALRVADALGAEYAVVQASSLRGIPSIGRAVETARFTRIATLGEGDERVYVYRIMAGAEAEAQAKALNRQAIEAAEAGDLQAAIAAWQQAGSLKPDFAPILANLALAYWRCNRPQEAYLHAQRALRADPSNATARKVVAAAEARG